MDNREGEIVLRTKATTTLRSKPGAEYTAVYVTAAGLAAKRKPLLAAEELARNAAARRHPTTRDDELESRGWTMLLESAGELRIVGAPGRWHLTTLLEDEWDSDSTLDLDTGEGWTVTNPKELIDEVRLLVGAEKFEEFRKCAERIKSHDWAIGDE